MKKHQTRVTIKIDPNLLTTEYDLIVCYDSLNFIIGYYGYSLYRINVMGSYNSIIFVWATTNIAKLIINKSESHKITVNGSMLDVLRCIKNDV